VEGNNTLNRFKRMPAGVLFITGCCLLFSIYYLGLWRMDVRFVDGQPVPAPPELRARYWPLYLCIGGFLAVVAYGFVLARRWSRPLFVAGSSLLLLVTCLLVYLSGQRITLWYVVIRSHYFLLPAAFAIASYSKPVARYFLNDDNSRSGA